APSALTDAVIVGLDVEWWEWDKDDLTELGVSILDTRLIPWTATIIQALSSVYTYHFRIKENAHLVNTDLCPGSPDNFQFGITKFINKEQARDMLLKAFTWPLREDTSELRPVIFVGHAVDNDIAMLQQHFGIDISALGCIVATVDTQQMAIEAGIRAKKQGVIGLRDLIGWFKVDVDPGELHTAGNDVAYTMIAAFLCAHKATKIIYPHQSVIKFILNRLKYRDHRLVDSRFGTEVFCTLCDSEEHMEQDCKEFVLCEKCGLYPRRVDQAMEHKTEKCVAGLKDLHSQSASPMKYPIPCQDCIMSISPDRFSKAYSHLTEDC
ncbi:hypothetical protein EJ04DRAFT_399242, partial [Polyplosphaeria fusca]